MEHSGKQWYGLVIWGVGFLVFFVNLGTMTVDIMEARNFVTVREMIQSGDWLHPTMNGVLRLEKPPLPTWITAIFAAIFGLKSLFFLRLPAALMALWMLFSMNALVKRLTQNPFLAMLSAVVLAGMLYVLLMGRRGTWDIYTHSFMLAAIVQFVAIFQSVRPFQKGVWGGLLFGAAFLSKGPVAAYAMLLPFLVLYFGYYKPFWVKGKGVAVLFYVLIGILISSSWFAFIHIVLGDEATQIINKEVTNWQSYNVRPWYYYLKDYPVHSGLWAAILTMSLLTTYTLNKSKDKKAFHFFWVWTMSAIVLLSIIPEKKVRYLLPTFLPASFLVASYFYYLIRDFTQNKSRLDTVVFRIHWSIFLVAALGLPVAAYVLFYSKGAMGWQVMLGIIAASLFCFYLIVKSAKQYKKPLLLVGAIGLLVTAVIFVLPRTDNVANKAFYSIEKVAAQKELQGLPCYALEETRIELVWLIGRKIKEVQTLKKLQPPYLLLTDKPPEQYVRNQNFQLIGHYDNNSKAKGHKHYEQSLTKYVSVVR